MFHKIYKSIVTLKIFYKTDLFFFRIQGKRKRTRKTLKNVKYVLKLIFKLSLTPFVIYLIYEVTKILNLRCVADTI